MSFLKAFGFGFFGRAPAVLSVLLLCAAVCCLMAPVNAEDLTPVSLVPLETDRPDFTETTTTVPKGSLQFENGVFWDKDNGVRTFHVPETLVRLGVGDTTELRLVVPEYLRSRGAETANNFTDLDVGLKQELGQIPGKIQLALMSMVNLPTGADKVSANGVGGSLTLLWSRDIGSKMNIGGNLELQLEHEDRQAVVGFVPSLVLGRQLTEKFGALVEYRGRFTDKGEAANILQYAVTYKIRPLHQLDARFAHALNGDAPAFIFGFGYSFRVDGLF